jgi:hypothetical protein
MYHYRLAILDDTTIGETQAMMEMVKHEYIQNLEQLSTSDVSELVQNEGKTVRAYNYISGLYAL